MIFHSSVGSGGLDADLNSSVGYRRVPLTRGLRGVKRLLHIAKRRGVDRVPLVPLGSWQWAYSFQ